MMTLDRPWALALMLLAPAIVGLYLFMLRRRRRFAVSYASLSLIRGAVTGTTRWRRRIPFALFLLAIVSLAVAAARPQSIITVPTKKRSATANSGDQPPPAHSVIQVSWSGWRSCTSDWALTGP